MQEIRHLRMEKHSTSSGKGCPEQDWDVSSSIPHQATSSALKEWVLLGFQSWESSLEIRELAPFFYEEIRELHHLKHSQRRSHPKYRPVFVIFPTKEIQTTSAAFSLEGCKTAQGRKLTAPSTAADVPLGINH